MLKIFRKSSYVFWSLASLIDKKAKTKRNSVGGVENKHVRINSMFVMNIFLTPLLLCLLTFCNGVLADDQVFEIDIPAQNAARSLEMLAEQTGAMTLFPYDIATQVQANAVNGKYTLEDALTVLLKDSGLLAGLSNQRVITIESMVEPQKMNEGKVMSKPMRKKSKVLAVLSSILMSVGINAHESEEPGAHLLEEVRVTARKTEESLSTTPLSISVFDIQELNSSGIKTVVDLAEFTPGFQIENDLGRRLQRPVMRGIENSRPEAAQPVSIYVDGIYTRSGLYSSISESVERVEILKGPQAALYGRSANGGVVNYISKRPEKEPAGKLSLSIAEHDNVEVDAYFSGAISENLSASLGLHHYEYGGEYKNKAALTKGAREIGSEKTDAIYAALYYKPVEQLEFVARAYYSEDKDGQIAAQLASAESDENTPCFDDIYCGTVPSVENVNISTSLDEGVFLGNDEDGSVFSQWDFRAGMDREISRSAITARYEFNNNMQLEWLGGYTKEESLDVLNTSYSTEFASNPLGLPDFLVVSAIQEKSDLKYFSNEIKLSGDFGSLDWMIGLFAYDEKRERTTWRLDSSLQRRQITRRTDLKERSIYGRANWQLSDKLSASAEGRVTNEKLTSFPFSSAEIENTSFNPRLTLDYKWSENLFIYSSVSSGEKLLNESTQFNDSGTLDVTFGSEVVKQFETGVKANLADGHIRFQAAAFWMRQSEKGVAINNFPLLSGSPYPTGFDGRDFPNETEIRGLELEYQWLVNKSWLIAANYAYTDAEFTKAEIQLFDVLSLDGLKRPRVPKHAMNAMLQYYYPFNNQWSSKTRLNAIYNSSRQGDEKNFIETGDQLDLNFRTSLVKRNVELSLWMENILDDETPSNAVTGIGFGGGGYVSFLPKGRQAGVSLKYEF